MAHLVNRRGYFSLEESYREGKKVRKRVIEYYGKSYRKPFNIFTDVDWSATLRGTPEDRAMQAADRAAEKAELEKQVVDAGSPVDAPLDDSQPDEQADTESAAGDDDTPE